MKEYGSFLITILVITVGKREKFHHLFKYYMTVTKHQIRDLIDYNQYILFSTYNSQLFRWFFFIPGEYDKLS